MRQFQNEGLDFEVFGLNIRFVLFSLLFSPDPAALEPVPPPVFWRQNRGSIHPVGPVFSWHYLTTKNLSNQYKCWVYGDFRPPKKPVIRLVNEQAATPINVANLPRQSTIPTPIG